MIIAEITGGKPGELIELPSTENSDEVFTYDNDPKVLAALKLATLINKCVDKFKAGEVINYLDLAQSLVESGVIVPPCNMGDFIFVIPSETNYRLNKLRGYAKHNKVHKQEVGEIRFYKNMEYLLITCGGLSSAASDFFNVDWFLTEEAAEKALKERERQCY